MTRVKRLKINDFYPSSSVTFLVFIFETIHLLRLGERDHQYVSVTRLSFGMTSKVHLVLSHPEKCLPTGTVSTKAQAEFTRQNRIRAVQFSSF